MQEFPQNTAETAAFKKKSFKVSSCLLFWGVVGFLWVWFLRLPDILKRNHKSASLSSCKRTSFISGTEIILANLKNYLQEIR